MRKLIEKYLASPHSPLILGGILIGICLVLLIGLGLGIWGFLDLKENLTRSAGELNQKIFKVETDLSTVAQMSLELSQKIKTAEEKSSEFEESISDIAGTVGTLEKLSKTDRELLQKYSRVYFLSDNYVPMRLKNIDSEYLYDATKDLQFHASALSKLEDMLDEASDDKIDLKIASAYRSFGTQALLKNGYLVTYGSGANQFSADQGYSEHQLGTAIDITTPGQEPILTTKFESTPAFEWLKNNAYKYGFVLSYPKNNAYYQYEPWHWRFVGVKLATKLHSDDINFSDMDQRDIDKYLVKIFD